MSGGNATAKTRRGANFVHFLRLSGSASMANKDIAEGLQQYVVADAGRVCVPNSRFVPEWGGRAVRTNRDFQGLTTHTWINSSRSYRSSRSAWGNGSG